MKPLIWLFCLFFILACHPKDDRLTDTQQEWKPIADNLWLSTTGEVGFKTFAMNESIEFDTVYITKTLMADDQYQSLKNIIDLKSFHQLKDSTFYKDENHIYQYYPMAGGGSFFIFATKELKMQADYDSFEVLNECFARDKEKIFHWRKGDDNNYDYHSFQTCADCGCIAKDRYRYYVIGEELSQLAVNNMIIDTETLESTRNALVFLSQR